MQLLFSIKQLITNKTARLALLTLLYYVSLVFVNANLQFLVVTVCYAIALFWLIKKWWLTLWFVFLMTLPLAKGTTLVFTLIPKEDLIERNAIFDINYILSFYLSDVVLAVLGWVIVKKIKPRLRSIVQVFRSLKWIGWSFLAFLIVALWPHREATFLSIIGLSSLQIIKVALLFLLPTTLLAMFNDQKKQFMPLTQFALLAGVFLQTGLALLQFWNGGPLGWYIEAILPLGTNGQPIAISTMENADILRVTGSFFDPSLLGTFMFSAFLWLWYQKPSITPTWLRWLGIFACNITIILTSNRLLMLSLIIWWGYQAFVVFKTNYHQQNKLLRKTHFNWMVGLGVLVAVTLIPYCIVRLNSLTSLFAKYGSGTYRIELMRYALRLVNGQPWGVGFNLSPYYLGTQFNQEIVSFDPAPPHNIVFQLLVETGFAGVGIAIWIIYLIYRPLRKRHTPQFFITGAGMGGLGFLYCAQFYPVFINQIETFSWFLVFLGIYWAEKQNLIHGKK